MNSSNKILLTLTILLFIISIINSIITIDRITGFFSGMLSGVLSLSVNENPQGVVTSFSYPSSVAVNNPMNLAVSFKNVGNVNITEKIIIFIKSANLQTSAILNDDTFTLGMNEIRIFNTTYTPASEGNFFAFVIVTYSNKTAEANASFTVNNGLTTPVQTATSPAVSVGGGGVTQPTIIETNTISKIIAGETATVSIDQADKIKIQDIEIETKNTVSDVQITVKEATLPTGIDKPIAADTGSVLKYLEVSKTNINEEDIAKAKISFKVEKSWVNSNSIDVNTVSLQRLENGWKKLPTNEVGEDSSFIYYEAESAGLSLFAITGEKRILTLDYPSYLKLNRGQSSLIQIFVRNDGNIDLNNLLLFASDSALSLETNPTSLSMLSPSSSFIFLISVKVSGEISPGMYPIDFTLASDKITKKGQINIEVEVQEIEVEVEQSIKNYESLIEKLFAEADKATAEGRNTSLAIESLNESKAELDVAKQLYDSQDFVKAKEQLEKVSMLVEQATVQLAQTVRPKIIFIKIPFPRPEIVGSVAGTIGMSGYYYYRKRKENESYRKSIRNAIQIIKNKEKK